MIPGRMVHARCVMASDIDRTEQNDPFISKSKFLSGLQCHKLLWHAYNAKDLIPDPTPPRKRSSIRATRLAHWPSRCS